MDVNNQLADYKSLNMSYSSNTNLYVKDFHPLSEINERKIGKYPMC